MSIPFNTSIVAQVRYYFQEIMPSIHHKHNKLTKNTVDMVKGLPTERVILVCSGNANSELLVREFSFCYLLTHQLQYPTHLFDSTLLRRMAFGDEDFISQDHIAPNTIVTIGTELRNSMNTEMLNAFVTDCCNSPKLRSLILYFNGTLVQFEHFYNTADAGELSYAHLWTNIDLVVEGVSCEGRVLKRRVRNTESAIASNTPIASIPEQKTVSQGVSTDDWKDIECEMSGANIEESDEVTEGNVTESQPESLSDKNQKSQVVVKSAAPKATEDPAYIEDKPKSPYTPRSQKQRKFLGK